MQLLFDIYGTTKVQVNHLKFIKDCIRADYGDYTEAEQNAADEITEYIDNITIDFTKGIEK